MTVTRLFNIMQILNGCKNDIFQLNFWTVFLGGFCAKHRLWVHVRTNEAVLLSTNNLCFREKIRNTSAYPCKSQFYYIKLGYEGI